MNILKAFNDLFGDIDWKDADRRWQFIIETNSFSGDGGHRLP
ncbi:MAG: hypothetical protein OXL41_14120 [Nitrospinae bacterium]|nr:hypothetical protein [Nitrospinota bacterium]